MDVVEATAILEITRACNGLFFNLAASCSLSLSLRVTPRPSTSMRIVVAICPRSSVSSFPSLEFAVSCSLVALSVFSILSLYSSEDDELLIDVEGVLTRTILIFPMGPILRDDPFSESVRSLIDEVLGVFGADTVSVVAASEGVALSTIPG